MYKYTILERGEEKDGGTWARYTCDPDGAECRMTVMAGLDLDEQIREDLDDEEYLDNIAASMSPEKAAEVDEIIARWDRWDREAREAREARKAREARSR